MTKVVSEVDKSPSKHSPKQRSLFSSYCSPRLSVYIFVSCVVIFILFQIQSLKTPFNSPYSTSSSSPWPFLQQWDRVVHPNLNFSCSLELKSMAAKLRQAVTFLPLKDLRYAETAQQGHTWFMSSMFDAHEEGEVQYQYFPSESSKGRLLCIMGRDTHDGARNSYALAWPETLPHNTTLLKGLTFVSYNHYDYGNMWHGLSAVVPFVAWHRTIGGCAAPTRWVLYHWGELRTKMGSWLTNLMEATFGGRLKIEGFDGIEGPACFEKAVVMRHNEGGMSRERRLQAYDQLRCKARVYCNVSLEGRAAEINEKGVPVIGLTMLMRTGARSFRNESVVVGIFEKECRKVDGCRSMVAYSSDLSFCDQVRLMSSTDILVSPHGAQLTNMFLMDRNSSVMEFFPKGWLKLAGVGQYVLQWLASWSGLRHQGAWRDPNGEECPYPEDDRRCFSIYKGGKIGCNETYFAEWARAVLNEVKINKMEEATKNHAIKQHLKPNGCACSS